MFFFDADRSFYQLACTCVVTVIKTGVSYPPKKTSSIQRTLESSSRRSEVTAKQSLVGLHASAPRTASVCTTLTFFAEE